MSKTRKSADAGGRQERRLSVRAIRRNPPDYRKLSRALIQLAMAEAEAEAQATRAKNTVDTGTGPTPEDHHGAA
jgi:hypothetical protein